MPQSRERRPLPISADQLERFLLDPSVSDDQLRPYLEVDPKSSLGFQPVVRIRPDAVDGELTESALFLSSFNGIERWRRAQRYRARRRHWDGPVAVSEGDSWFQFPFILSDVIDQLAPQYAIYSLGGAGDTVADYVAQDELAAAIRSERPHVVLLSGGGNDLLGAGRLSRAVHPFDPAKSAEAHITEEYQGTLNAVLSQYGELWETALSAGGPRIVCHCYDHAIPDGGRWLGRPMASKGIIDPALQRSIVAVMIDRFHDALQRFAARREFNGAVIVADTRGSIGGSTSEWWDELHPEDAGFARAAVRIRAAIEAPPSEHVQVPGARVEEASPTDPYAGMSDAILQAEIGRRIMLMQSAPDDVPTGLGAIDIGIGEGPFQNFFMIGRRVAKRLSRELHGVICGDDPDDVASREQLKEALKLDSAAVIAAVTSILIGMGVGTAVAPLVAVLLYRAGIKPTIEELCEIWGEAVVD